MPISGALVKQINYVTVLGCFDILVNNDVPITQALIVLEDAATNIRIKYYYRNEKRCYQGTPYFRPIN